MSQPCTRPFHGMGLHKGRQHHLNTSRNQTRCLHLCMRPVSMFAFLASCMCRGRMPSEEHLARDWKVMLSLRWTCQYAASLNCTYSVYLLALSARLVQPKCRYVEVALNELHAQVLSQAQRPTKLHCPHIALL
jgi:hypothetical protein